jgi:hypothetical protein
MVLFSLQLSCKLRGGPLEKCWGGSKKKNRAGKNRKKIRAPEKFEKKIRAETFQ